MEKIQRIQNYLRTFFPQVKWDDLTENEIIIFDAASKLSKGLSKTEQATNEEIRKCLFSPKPKSDLFEVKASGDLNKREIKLKFNFPSSLLNRILQDMENESSLEDER